MIGIYKITNTINNKIYIGQSVNIAKRWTQYKNIYDYTIKTPIIKAIEKYGINNFKFEIIETCSIEDLDEREIYWIKYYDSNKTGYNVTAGGEHCRGEDNANAKVTEQDVIFIRELYDSKTPLKKKYIYDTYFANKISYRGFEKIWSGITWKHIMPEVFSEENKNYYKTTAKGNIGENNSFTKVNDKIVNEMRQEYQEKSISEIAEKYKDILSYSAVERILLGITYKRLPIYKKKENKWITL